MLITVGCRMCGVDHVLEVDEKKLKAWQNGMHIQDAFPDMSADNRELMISNTCGKCFDKLFTFQPEEN